jgi:hypothetical protein
MIFGGTFYRPPTCFLNKNITSEVFFFIKKFPYNEKGQAGAGWFALAYHCSCFTIPL